MWKTVLYVVGAGFFGTLFTGFIFMAGLMGAVLLATLWGVEGNLENQSVTCGLVIYLAALDRLQCRIQTWPTILRVVLFVCLPLGILILLRQAAPVWAIVGLSVIAALPCYQWIVTTFSEARRPL